MILSLALLLTGTLIYSQDFTIPVEANGGYIDFDEDSRFKDTWYVGGAAGLDFSENAGIRGYYWRALDDGQIDEFDNLEIYGAESKVKVPLSESIKPYLVVGGGLLKPFNNYIDANGNIENDNHFFGSAGAGLDLNFIRFVSLTGYARAMFSDFSQINTLDNDVTTSWNYGASLNINLFQGKKDKSSNSTGSTIVMPEPTIQKVEKQEQVIKDQSEEIKELEDRIESIENERVREKELEELKKEIQQEIHMELHHNHDDDSDGDSKKKIKKEKKKNKKEDKELKDKDMSDDDTGAVSSVVEEVFVENKELEDEVESLEKELDKMKKEEEKSANQILDRQYLSSVQQSLSREDFQTVMEQTVIGSGDTVKDRLFYNYSNVFLAGGFGKNGYGEALIGVKPSFYVAGTSIQFVPEASIGFGNGTSFNVLANANKSIDIENDNLSPYVGAGLGFIMPNGSFTPAINLQAGSKINNVLDGKLNAEFATRNFFNYNQISVGYELF